MGRIVSGIKEKTFNLGITSGQTREEFAKDMNKLDLPKSRRIDEAVALNFAGGYSLELVHIYEDKFSIHDLRQLLDRLKPIEWVLDIRMSNE